MRTIWDWLQRRFYHTTGLLKPLSFLYISMPFIVALLGFCINSNPVWALGIGLQILCIILLITGSRKYQRSH